MKALPLRVSTRALVALVFLLATSSSAFAQTRRVVQLNREGMEAYMNLELDQAQSLLEQALEVAQSSGVTGSTLAQTYANLGVVAVGGFGDNAQGLQHFTSALRADPSVQPDPLTTTPDIERVFLLARNRQGNSGQGGQSNQGSQQPPRGSGIAPPPGAEGAAEIPHLAFPGQRTNTAIPVFVDAPSDAPIGRVIVSYRVQGTSHWSEAEMRRMEGGYGYEIPCASVMAPAVEYFILAYDRGDAPLGYAGSPSQPFNVAVSSSFSGEPPALPGAPAPRQCMESECPPGMAGCTSHGTAGLGETCGGTSDCREGLMCDDNFCVVDSGEGDEDPEEDDEASDEMPRFFLRVGFAAGFGLLGEGALADSRPVEGNNPNEYIQIDDPDCQPGNAEETYCVRLQASGLAPSLGIRATFGGFIVPRFGLAATFRYNFSGGEGTLSHFLIGLRAMVLLTTPAAEGVHVDLHLGTSYGQIQFKPTMTESAYAVSGLNGVQLGGTFGYRFTRNIGLYVTPEAHFLLPQFRFVIDLDIGVGVSF